VISWLFSVFGYHHIHGKPGVLGQRPTRAGRLYLARANKAQSLPLRPRDPTFKRDLSPKGRKAPNGMPGGFLSISANGDRDGVVWACSPLLKDALIDTVPGVLRAFDAVTLKQLWSSDKKDPEGPLQLRQELPPTVANGKVYLSTFSNKLNVYGLVKPPPPPKEEKGSLKGKPKLISPAKPHNGFGFRFLVSRYLVFSLFSAAWWLVFGILVFASTTRSSEKQKENGALAFIAVSPRRIVVRSHGRQEGLPIYGGGSIFQSEPLKMKC